MQEGDSNDSYSRMRMQHLRDGQLSQMQQRQQQQPVMSQALPGVAQPEMWSGDATPPGPGQNAWGGQFNTGVQAPGIGGPSGDKHSPNAVPNPQGPSTSDAWAASPGSRVNAESPPEQHDNALWSGSPFGGISRSIWSGGEFRDTSPLPVTRARSTLMLNNCMIVMDADHIFMYCSLVRSRGTSVGDKI